MGDPLLYSVLEKLKVFAVETTDGGSTPIADLDRYHDQRDIHTQGAWKRDRDLG
jgi:hypothetical protein